MTENTLTLACWDYDRTRPLLEGRVGVPGWRIDAAIMPPEELFPRAVTDAPFDVSELSLSSYLIQVSRGESAYVAIPAFVSRAFRHGGIYIRTASGIKTPKDLEGRLVGVPEYQMTMALWARGMLQDEYGVDTGKLKYRTGGTNKPGRKERLSLNLPERMDVEPVPEGRTLNDLLLAGELDAVLSPAPPDAFVAGDDGIERLFADPAAAEREYFGKTGMFPIMHVIGVRRTLVDENEGLAADLYRAFLEARRLAMEDLELTAKASANRLSLPWFAAEWEQTRALMGEGFWPYGVSENRKELEAVCRYSLDQHLSDRLLSVDELFAPETLDLPGI